MSDRPDNTPAGERIPQELVDTFFDRELDEGSRERFFGMLRADLSRCAQVAKTQRMISMLREPIEGPDLTGRIMATVSRRRGFLPERVRRMVTTGRLAAAACVLLGVLGLAVARRMAPDALRLEPVSRPLSEVIESGKADAAEGVKHMAAVVAIHAPASSIALSAGRARGFAGLTPGKTSVRTLPHGATAMISLPLGAGCEARFVFIDGACIDRSTSAKLALGSFATDGANCPEAIEQFIVRVVQGAGVIPSGSSAAGRNSVE